MAMTERALRDDRTRADRMTISWTGVDARRYRMVFEPRSSGGHRRIVQRKTEVGWVETGTEIVSDVARGPDAVGLD
jgi:hypothetical protein